MKKKELKKMKSQDIAWITIRLDELEEHLDATEKAIEVIGNEVKDAKTLVVKLKKKWVNK